MGRCSVTIHLRHDRSYFCLKYPFQSALRFFYYNYYVFQIITNTSLVLLTAGVRSLKHVTIHVVLDQNGN